VDMTKPGAQEYYNSVFALFAAWDVDFVKVDDLSRPYHRAEIEGIRKAIDHSGRAMVLSLSPGETPLNAGAHVSQNANIWRVSDDFWDKWPLLLEQFERLRKWTEFRGPGHFPDADMLPLGIISMGKPTHFTPPEQYTLMTLWCIARSPLIFGGDLTKLDDFTRKLITNPEVLAVDQNSTGNRQLFCKDGLIAWVADVPNSKDKYLALFNTRSGEQGKAAGEDAQILVDLAEFGFHERAQARDLWSHKDLGMITNQFAQSIPSHGAGLFRFSPAGERAALPTIFLIGDSTVNNSTKGLQGWGAPLPAFFDTNKVIILNRARGGRSSRTYFTEGLWDQVRQQLKPGDFVLMQFGHNDGGSLTSNRARASLKGVGDESQEVLIEATGKPEVVHTYGWYLRKYVNETKAQGATPIVLTPVPRNMWKDGKVNRSAGDYGGWAAEVAKKEGVENIDLNEIVARHYEAEGQSNVLAKYFTAADHTHTTPDGAKLSAVCVVEGIKGLKESTLKGLLTTQKP
jgi:lysophospholipase L1-like esterase